MNTIERAGALAHAAAAFPFLGVTSADHLLELLAEEIGDALGLEEFFPRGSFLTRAIAPKAILHVIAGNTPAAGLQTLIRGLLLGSTNLLKLPSEGLPAIDEFCHMLPAGLASLVETNTELPADWLERANAVIVFGSDSTIEHFKSLVRPEQIFIPYGHRLSFGVVFEDLEFGSIDAAARDSSAFDQLGCLSPQVFYVQNSPREYAERLAGAMDRFSALYPRGSVSLSVSNSIRALREETKFRAALGEACAVFESMGSTEWTVIFDEAPGFPNSPLHRTIFVKPLPQDLTAELAKVRAHLSCAGVYPASPGNALRLMNCGVSRICPLGHMQIPPWTWHQDGEMSIARLVSWIDFEPA